MSAESGYGNAVTSGLTFAYDVGDTKNSFKGKPAINYVANAGTMANFGNYSCGTPVTFTTEFGTTGYRMANLGSWNGVVMGGISLPSTGTYTFSAYIRYIGGSPNNNGGTVYTSGFGISDTASYHNKSNPGEWVRVSNTQNCTGTNGTFYLISFGGTYCDDFSSWEVTMPQIESGSVATRWVEGTRSSTGGLIDLTGEKTINVSNVTFESGETIVFDATDDYLTLGSDYNFKTTGGWTVESLVYYNSVAGGYNNTTSPANFIGSEDINYNSWYWSVLNNKLALWNISPGYWRYGSTTLQPNTWYHVVLTCSDDGTTYRFYLNGVPENGDHVTQSWNPSYSGLRIRYFGMGNNANPRLINGKINVTKVYNRSLSQSEIARNALNYKTKYSITIKDGSTSALAAPSATHLKNLGISKDGVYWLQPSGQSAFQVPVKFHLNKAMVCVMKGGNGSGYIPDSSYWENTTLDNTSDFTLTNGVRSKYQSYNVVPFTEFYWTMGEINYQSTFSLASEVSSMYTAQTRSWNDSANRSTPHFGNSIDYRSLVGADRRYTSALGTEFYLMGMDLKHEGHYGGGGGSSGGRIRVGSILDESTGNTVGEAYSNAGSAFGIGVNGGNPLKTGVCGYAGWTEPSVIGETDNWSLWVVF